jgi:hypothetical protein
MTYALTEEEFKKRIAEFNRAQANQNKAISRSGKL